MSIKTGPRGRWPFAISIILNKTSAYFRIRIVYRKRRLAFGSLHVRARNKSNESTVNLITFSAKTILRSDDTVILIKSFETCWILSLNAKLQFEGDEVWLNDFLSLTYTYTICTFKLVGRNELIFHCSFSPRRRYIDT